MKTSERSMIPWAAIAGLILAFLIFVIPVHCQNLSEAPRPKFFDRQTRIELTASAAAFAIDAWTTNDFRSRGYIEINPLARPFTHSTPGTVAYFGATFGGQIGAMYYFRNRPRVKHWIPRTTAALEFGFGIFNLATTRKDYHGKIKIR